VLRKLFSKKKFLSFDPEGKLAEKVEIYEKICQPISCCFRGYIDEVIYPEQTREKLIRAFQMLENKVASYLKRNMEIFVVIIVRLMRTARQAT